MTAARDADGVWRKPDGSWWQTMPRVLPYAPAQMRGHRSEMCARCARPGRVVVLGLRWCDECAVVASFALPEAPLCGLGYTLAVCALVQWMRQRIDGAWVRRVVDVVTAPEVEPTTNGVQRYERRR